APNIGKALRAGCFRFEPCFVLDMATSFTTSHRSRTNLKTSSTLSLFLLCHRLLGGELDDSRRTSALNRLLQRPTIGLGDGAQQRKSSPLRYETYSRSTIWGASAG